MSSITHNAADGVAPNTPLHWQQVGRWAGNLHRAWVRSRTIAALSSLDDATLKDIGVPRSGIRAHVRDLECGIDPRMPMI